MKCDFIRIILQRFCSVIILIFLLHASAFALDVVFRLDDLYLNPNAFDLRITSLFNDKKIPLSIAVISCNPFEEYILPNDSDYINFLNHGDFEIAIHGLSHQNFNGEGEFGTLNSVESFNRISKAKSFLQDYYSKSIQTFIPPFNQINSTILKDIKKDSIFIFSADMFSYEYVEGVEYYPETLGHMMENYGIWNALMNVLKNNSKDDNAICVVMFHKYDLGTESDWDSLSKILDLCNAESNINTYTFSGLHNSGNHSSWLRYWSNQLNSGLKKIILLDGILYSPWICLGTHILNALIYTILFLLLPVIALLRRRMGGTAIIFLTTFFSICIFCLVWFQFLGPQKLLLVTMLTSVAYTTLIHFCRK